MPAEPVILSTPTCPVMQRMALADRMRLSMETDIYELNTSPCLELPAGSSIVDDIDIAARLVLRVDKVLLMHHIEGSFEPNIQCG